MLLTPASEAWRSGFTPAYRVEASCCRASEGSVAVGSCDHRGASASSSLVELGDLQGDVDQGRQHHLHTAENINITGLPLIRALLKSIKACQQSAGYRS